MTGFKFTTLDRFEGNTPTGSLLWDSAQWIGVPLLLAVVGAVAYARRPVTEPGERMAPSGGRLRRGLLGGLMAVSAVLAPIQQIHIHTETSLYKHVGFGLMLAAPIAGVGLARIIGDHFRRTQIGIAIWGASLAIGMTCANNLFDSWPNSSVFIADLAHYIRPDGRYLVEVDEVPIYYLRDNPGAQPRQFTSTYYIGYTTSQGQFLTGNAGYVAAIKAGYFNVVAFNYQTTPGSTRSSRRRWPPTRITAWPTSYPTATTPSGSTSGSRPASGAPPRCAMTAAPADGPCRARPRGRARPPAAGRRSRSRTAWPW